MELKDQGAETRMITNKHVPNKRLWNQKLKLTELEEGIDTPVIAGDLSSPLSR